MNRNFCNDWHMNSSLVYFTIESVESGITGNNNQKKEVLRSAER
ncbi:hypothetical protein BCO26_2340 [Heyndrickxia coagulans 2-6]|nr:hypothetical protein BCO26_2340 [Heyndrickxia coagulans 2-6]